MLTSYQREQLREEHAQNTNNFINVVLDSIGRKREIEAQQRLRDAQARQIEQMIGINNQFLPIQDPDTGVVSYQPRPTPATPFAGGVPTPHGMSYTLSPQALAQQNALNVQGAPPQPGQSPLSVVGFTSKGPRFGIDPAQQQRQKSLIDVEKENIQRINNAQNSAADFQLFSEQFQLSQAELEKQFPGFDKADIAGFGIRQVAKVANAFGALPETKSFRDSIQSFATPLAKSAGEDRLTNEDIVRFTSTLQDTLSNPSETNARKMRSILLGFKNKGADISTILDTFDQSGGILKRSSALVRSFKEDVQSAGKQSDSRLSSEDALSIIKGLKK